MSAARAPSSPRAANRRSRPRVNIVRRRMCLARCLRFVTSAEAEVEELPWGPHEWLARAGLTQSKLLQLVRVKMPPGKAHAFHRHPCMEELLYYVEGRAEQWVGREKRVLSAGDVAH